MKEEVFRMERVTYQNRGVTQLEDFNLQIYRGEIMGFMPVNSQGLSAFLTLVGNNLPLSDGYYYYCGEMVNSWRGCKRNQNKACIIQASSCLVPGMTVTDSIFVLRQGFRQELLHKKLLESQLLPFLEEIDMNISVDSYVEKLTVFERIVVEILRAVVTGQHLIIFDEIGDIISMDERRKLFDIMRFYTAKGFSFLYISLSVDEIAEICDRAVLMSHGRIQKVIGKKEMSREKLKPYVEEFSHALKVDKTFFRKEETSDEEVFALENIRYGDEGQLSIRFHKGECLILHCANYDVLEAFSEAIQNRKAGSDIAILQEQVTKSMIFPQMNYLDNLCFGISRRVPGVWRSRRMKRSIRQELGSGIDEKLFYLNIDDLSEREKYQLVYLRILLQKPKVAFCIQPFKGADFSHRQYIYEQLKALQSRGTAVVILTVNVSDALPMTENIVTIDEKGKKE